MISEENTMSEEGAYQEKAVMRGFVAALKGNKENPYTDDVSKRELWNYGFECYHKHEMPELVMNRLESDFPQYCRSDTLTRFCSGQGLGMLWDRLWYGSWRYSR